ncbi:hypothetical protein [Streptomyces sp900116325]|uniref:hypothetical protein n=1 Tax=Streptomyces sp. 900116325 TaxID=3154295 RepID=UPI0033E98731
MTEPRTTPDNPATSDDAADNLREQYAAAISAKIDGTAGCANGHRLADAVLAVRDREMERLKLLVAASSEPGQAVRMAAQYADRAIENGKRAEEAEAERNRVQQAACRTAENLRKAEARVAELERLLADELTALDQPQQPEAKAPVGWTSSCRCHSREGLAPQQHENDCPDAIAQPQQPTIGIYAADPDCETGDVRTCTVACAVHGETTEQQPTTTEAPC